MILNVMQAAAADPVPWWASATAPWWAAPVATLAGAVLAWFLGRLTSNRVKSDERDREAAELKRHTYIEFWSIALEHARASAPIDADAQQAALLKAGETMLIIELVAPPEVLAAARDVFGQMASRAALDVARTEAMRVLKEAIRKDLDISPKKK